MKENKGMSGKKATGTGKLPVAAKRLGAVLVYLLLLCFFLKIEIFLLFEPPYVGIFLTGCVILCVPHLERGTGWGEVKSLLRKNVITAGYLEAFMLLYVSMNQGEQIQNAPWRELALDLRPLFYALICCLVIKEPEAAGDEKEAGVDEMDREEPETFHKERQINRSETDRRKLPLKEPENDSVQGTVKEPGGSIDFSILTRQEKLVAELAGRGLTNREIGEELCISETTVKKHLSNIYEKLQISSRKELKTGKT